MTAGREAAIKWWRKAYEEESDWDNSFLGSQVWIKVFWSHSKGSGRKKRRYPVQVILVSFDSNQRWYHLRNRKSLNKLDRLITEVLRGMDTGNQNPLDHFWNVIQEEARRNC